VPLHRTCAEPTPLIPQRKKTYPRPLIRPHTSRILARSGGADRWRPVAERGAVPATRPGYGTTRRGTTSPAHEDDGPRRPGRPSSSSPSGTTTGCQELALRAVCAGPHSPSPARGGLGRGNPLSTRKGSGAGRPVERDHGASQHAETGSPAHRPEREDGDLKTSRRALWRAPLLKLPRGARQAPATPSLARGTKREGT